MRLRQARKILHKAATDAGSGRPRRYRWDTLGAALARGRKRNGLVARHACVCGRQRYKPSDKNRPCTFKRCVTHREEPIPGAFGSNAGRIR